MRFVLFIVGFLMAMPAWSITYQLGFTGTPVGSGTCNALPESYQATNTCVSALAAVNACMTANNFTEYTALSCSAATIVAGTKVYINAGQTAYVTAVAPVTKCPAGQYYNFGLKLCASETAVTISNCLPSIRTISPCPSGYAPSVSSYSQSDPTTHYSNPLDGVAIQEILYAIGMAVCAAVGIGVGVKLV